MKNSLIKSTIVTALIFGLVGCDSGSSEPVAMSEEEAVTQIVLPVNVVDAINSPKVTLSQDLKDAITFMYNEEVLAYDIYLAMNEEQPLKQLQNIASKSEDEYNRRMLFFGQYVLSPGVPWRVN